MKLFCTLTLLLLLKITYSQETKTPVLEREVSVSATNQSLEIILNDISFQGGFVFSYNPQAINHKRNVSLAVNDKSVRYTLNYLFKDENVEYKVKGKYVILKKKDKEEDTKILEGYVYDSKTGKRLTEASVYDKSLLASAITDKYGYFSMEVPANTPIKALQVSKLGYGDTMLLAIDSAIRFRNIEVSMNQEDTLKKPLLNLEKIIPGWLVSDKIKINARNITQPVFKTTQFSLIPYLSTNKFLGGVAINDFSFNATVGYVQGIRKFEAGGIMNYVRGDVSYFQAAGIANMVGGNLKGFQGAGIYNMVTNVDGFQSAGIFNIVNDVDGFQAAGIFNQAETVRGGQAAGIYNIVKDTATIQVAGLFNLATKNTVQVAGLFSKATETKTQTSGLFNWSRSAYFQTAGYMNVTDSLEVGQIAGFLNTTRSASEVQIAGAVNLSNDADVQIGGLLNKARHLKSFQLAVFNIADTSSGVSVGLFSFIRKGYHKLEISGDDAFPLNVAFRTGSQKFYTFLNAGTSSLNTNSFIWNLGYGIGTSMGNPARTVFDIDLSTSELFYRNHITGNHHLYKLYLGLDTKIAKKISIAYGISYNCLLSDSFEPYYEEIKSRIPLYTLTETNFTNGHNLKTWIGGKIALRFF